MKKPKAKKAAKARKTTHRSLKAAMKTVKARGRWRKPRGIATVDVKPVKGGGRPPETRRIDQIKIGKRHRKDYGDVAALARSIEARGALLQPIVITDKNELIAGERRIRAWKMTRFALEPIPVHVVSIDAIIAGEYDENAERKDFTLSEAVAIKTEIQKELSKLAKANVAAGKKAAPGQKVGRAGDKAAKFTGKGRRTLEKAEEIVAAAKQDPEKFGKLKADMDRTGRADGPHKRLKIMKQTQAIKDAPPVAAFEGKRKVVVVDYPWPHEPGMTQAEIDAAARSLRPYPAMAIEEGCKFMAKQVAPILDDDVVVYFWTTNYHLINGHAGKLLHALGFDERSTMLTWDKDLLGRGQVLREVTEHCIIAFRGKPVINILGEDPPTTLIKERRRENSRKPDAFYRLVERATPAARYASIFSRGGEGELWDCHGDEVGKYAPGAEPPAPAAPEQEQELTDDEKLLAALKAVEYGQQPDKALLSTEEYEFTGKGKKRKPVLTWVGRRRLDELRDEVRDDELLALLTKIEAGEPVDVAKKVLAPLRAQRRITGTKKLSLTKSGREQLAELREGGDIRRICRDLPASIDDLTEEYFKALVGREAGILANNPAQVSAASRRLEAIIRRANGGTLFGSATKESPAETIRARSTSPIGKPPLWGQRGVFPIEVKGVRAIVVHDDQMDFEMFAVDPDAGFISETGFTSMGYYHDNEDGGGDGLIARSVYEQACVLLRQSIDTEDGSNGKRRPRKGALPKPARVYTLPAKSDGDPKVISAKAARAALAEAKVAAMADPKSGLVKVDKTHHVAPGFVTSEEAAKLIGKAELERSLREGGFADHGHHPDVVAYAEANGHTVAMTIDQEGWSVGTCACEKPGAHWRFPRNETRNMDAAIDAHWRAQMIAAGLTPPEEDQLEIPGFLDRRNDKPAGATPAAEAAE